VKPLAAELTVWNHTVGYAGTLDLVAEIGGRVCLIDYKTRGTDRSGRVKSLNSNVVMQLAAGYKAEESLVDAQAGTWEPWAMGKTQCCLGLLSARQKSPPTKLSPRYWPNTGRNSGPCVRCGSISKLSTLHRTHCNL